jgi:hypothetical protein
MFGKKNKNYKIYLQLKNGIEMTMDIDKYFKIKEVDAQFNYKKRAYIFIRPILFDSFIIFFEQIKHLYISQNCKTVFEYKDTCPE